MDISNANTLIVERADTFGLSQLHQLRGRVGRSRERGYAYFLYPPQAPLTETAYDRLATIAQNNELGAGMAVALKDLEIRGAGNVLGVEQSGHVAGVGFDLYLRLVGEAVEAYRAAADGKMVTTPEEPKDVRIDLPVDAHLPPDYIGSDRLRLEAYRRLATATSDSGVAAVVDELIDATGLCRSRHCGWSRWRGCGCCAGPRASPTCRRRLRRQFGWHRWICPIPPRCGSSGCIREATTGLRRPPCRYPSRVTVASVRRASGMWSWCRWWPIW